jgi:Protein of unknown function (DUF3102)
MSAITTTVSKKPIIGKRTIEQINGYHYQIENMGMSLLEAALCAGELISKVKADLPHGTFMNWVQQNLKFSHKTATNYIRIYDLDEAGKLETVANISEAYKLITSPPKIATSPPAPSKPASPLVIEAEIVEPPKPATIEANAEVIASRPMPEPVDDELEAVVVDGTKEAALSPPITRKIQLPKDEDMVKYLRSKVFQMNPEWATFRPDSIEKIAEAYKTRSIDESEKLIQNLAYELWILGPDERTKLLTELLNS